MDFALDNVEKMLKNFIVKPAIQENALTKCVDSWDEMTQNYVRCYFVQRHAWFVRGLASLGDDSNTSSPTNILQDKVEEFVQGALEQRMGSNRIDLMDMAVLAAT